MNIRSLENAIYDVEDRAEEAVSIAQQATYEVNKLTDELEKERQRIHQLEEQVKQNKAEAVRANERIDNLLKLQQLTGFTKEELAFAKMEKAPTQSRRD